MATLNLQCAQSEDDAREDFYDNMELVNSPALSIGSFGIYGHCGFRFPTVSGLNGSTITSAILTFRADPTYGDDTGDFTGTMYAHKTNAPGVFTATANNITDTAQRPRTAGISCGSAELGNWTKGQDYTFDVKTIIQELADDQTPTAIVLLHIYGSGLGERRPESWDSDSGNAVKLDIVYTAGGAADGTITAAGAALTTDASSPASIWTGDATLTVVPALTAGLASSPPGELTATAAGTIVAGVASAAASSPVSIWAADSTLTVVTALTTGATSPASSILATAAGDWIARDSTQFSLTRADLPTNAVFYLEAVMVTDNASNTVKGRLYNVTDDTPVVGSEVTSVATAEEPNLSSAFGISDPGVTKTYRFESGGDVGGNYIWHIAKLLVDW